MQRDAINFGTVGSQIRKELRHKGLMDPKIAMGNFTFSSEFSCRLSLKCPSGVFFAITCHFLMHDTRSSLITRRTLKFSSNLKLPNFSEKQKTFFFPFSVEQHKEGEKMDEKKLSTSYFSPLFSRLFTDTEKRRGNLWSRACLCPFYCLF